MTNNLEKFKDDLNGSPPNPPYRISAGKLDRNFEKCYPKDWDGDSKPYVVKREDNGWLISPVYWPPPGNGTFVLGAVDGKMQWIATEDCDT
jgi:hypothetical protein